MTANHEQIQKETRTLRLLKKLTLATEARNEASKGKYPAGRLKRFLDVFRSNYYGMAMTNVLSILFFTPLIISIVLFIVFGAENLSYKIYETETPYLLSNFGFGLSSGVPIATVKVAMLVPYKLLSCVFAVLFPLCGFGLAGILYVSTKMIWGESFICKKDKKFGADIPRYALEFFRGVRLFWKQSVLFSACFGIVFAGSANLIILFIEGVFSGNAGVGHYFALIFGSLIALASTIIFMHILPLVVSYKIRIIDKFKNASIYSLVFFIRDIFVIGFTALPFALLFTGNSFVMIIIVIFLVMLGIPFFVLMYVNYSDYLSETILLPLYDMSLHNDAKKGKKKTNDSNKNKTQLAITDTSQSSSSQTDNTANKSNVAEKGSNAQKDNVKKRSKRPNKGMGHR
jgi:hypothetical protein